VVGPECERWEVEHAVPDFSAGLCGLAGSDRRPTWSQGGSAYIQRSGVSTLAAIAKALEARGVRTPAGRPNWRPVQVSRLMAVH